MCLFGFPSNQPKNGSLKKNHAQLNIPFGVTAGCLAPRHTQEIQLTQDLIELFVKYQARSQTVAQGLLAIYRLVEKEQ